MGNTRTENIVKAPVESVYSVVADIESYPEFIHNCQASKVISCAREGDKELIKAQLTLSLGPLRKSFITSNVNIINTSISIKLHSGQIRQIEGLWTFHAIDAKSTLVRCDLDFSFGANTVNKIAEKALRKFIEQLSQAFIDRALAIEYASD